MTADAQPIFVDESGRRRQRFRRSGYAAMALFGCYVALAIAGLTGHGPLAGIQLPFAGGRAAPSSAATVRPNSSQQPAIERFSPARTGRDASPTQEPHKAGTPAPPAGASTPALVAHPARTSTVSTAAGGALADASEPSPTDPGRSAPGQPATAPGNSASAPGHADIGAAPGKSSTAPGHADTGAAPGKSGTAPGKSSTAPGKSDAHTKS